jgi:hypothetical protein
MPKDLGLLIRYQTAADRAFHKAHSELLKIQKERKKLEIGFVSQDAEEAPADPAAGAETSCPEAAPQVPATSETAPEEQKTTLPDDQLPKAA